MFLLWQRLGNAKQALLALAVLGLLPVAVEAAGIYFSNETNQIIYVRCYSIINGQRVQGQLLSIPPKGILMDINVPKGDRYIRITDGSNRVLFEEPRYFDGTDAFYGVVPMPMKGPPKVFLDKRAMPMKK
jgi:hypothetical protein